MSFAVIAGVTYNVQVSGTTENERERIGQVRRTFDGSMRSSVRAEKSAFSLNLSPILQAAFDTLKTNTALAAIVACSGDFTGGVAMNCIVTIKSAEYFKPSASGPMYRVPVLDIIQA